MIIHSSLEYKKRSIRYYRMERESVMVAFTSDMSLLNHRINSLPKLTMFNT